MVKNIEVKNNNNESNSNLIRRFSRRVRNSDVLDQARESEVYEREKSENRKKKEALEKKRRLEKIDKMIKLGKLPDRRDKNREMDTLAGEEE